MPDQEASLHIQQFNICEFLQGIMKMPGIAARLV
jgi:hypothetical protein